MNELIYLSWLKHITTRYNNTTHITMTLNLVGKITKKNSLKECVFVNLSKIHSYKLLFGDFSHWEYT